MRREIALAAANDNGNSPQIRVENLKGRPISVVEVEIFDALISNIAALVANDNESTPRREID